MISTFTKVHALPFTVGIFKSFPGYASSAKLVFSSVTFCTIGFEVFVYLLHSFLLERGLGNPSYISSKLPIRAVACSQLTSHCELKVKSLVL